MNLVRLSGIYQMGAFFTSTEKVTGAWQSEKWSSLFCWRKLPYFDGKGNYGKISIAYEYVVPFVSTM